MEETAAEGTTFTDASPTFPSELAEMIAAPPASAVTRPDVETVATEGLLLNHVTGRLASVSPDSSRASATKLMVPPTVRFALAGKSVTVATGVGDTVRDESPLFPSTLAAMSTRPSFRPVT